MVDKIYISSFIALEYATIPDILKQKIIKELTLDNPEYIRMLHLSKPTFKSKHQALYRVSTDPKTLKQWFILPRGFLPSLIQLYKGQGCSLRLIDQRLTKPKVAFDSSIVLRDYQQPAVEQALQAKSGIIQAPCGSGKTIIGLEIIARARQPALWLVHTKDLMEQARDRIQEYLRIPRNEIGTIGDGKVVIGERITVGMVQTLERRLDIELTNRFGLVLLDEAHHAPAKTFSQVVGAFPALYRFGLTATPHRRDGMHPLMYYTIGYTIHKISPAELIDSGSLVVPIFKLVPTAFSFHYDDNYAKMIEALTQDEERNKLIIQQVAQEAQACHYCLVLSERVEHCLLLHGMLQNISDVKAAVLTGELDTADRQKALNGLRNKSINVVFATKVADEGLDIAHLDRLFLATPYRSAYKVKQQVGRVMRPAEGKENAVVYDFVDERQQVLKNQVEIRKAVYDSFQDYMAEGLAARAAMINHRVARASDDTATVEHPLPLDAVEKLYTIPQSIPEETSLPVLSRRRNGDQRLPRAKPAAKEHAKKAGKRVKRRYQAICSGCGRQTSVPFVPDGRRPVYCDECFNRKSTTMGRALHQAFSKQRLDKRNNQD